jgi:hypothetical protein
VAAQTARAFPLWVFLAPTFLRAAVTSIQDMSTYLLTRWKNALISFLKSLRDDGVNSIMIIGKLGDFCSKLVFIYKM